MNPDLKSIKRNLAIVFKESGLSRNKLAKKMGIHHDTLNSIIFVEDYDITLSHILKMANALHVPVDKLMFAGKNITIPKPKVIIRPYPDDEKQSDTEDYFSDIKL